MIKYCFINLKQQLGMYCLIDQQSKLSRNHNNLKQTISNN